MPHVARLPPISLLKPTPLAVRRLPRRAVAKPFFVVLVHDLLAALRAPPDGVALPRLAWLELRLPAATRDAEPALRCARERFGPELGAAEVEPLALALRVVAADHGAVLGAEAVAEVLDGGGGGLGADVVVVGGWRVFCERRGLLGCGSRRSNGRGSGSDRSSGSWSLVGVERGLGLFGLGVFGGNARFEADDAVERV